MNTIIKIVKSNIKDAETKFINVERRLKSAPDGSIIFSSSHGQNQYIFVDGSGKKKYLSNKKKELIIIMAQKKYDEYAYKYLIAKLKLLKLILAKLESTKGSSTLITKIPKVLRPDIIPIELSDEEYAKQWESVQFKGKEIKEGTTTYITDKNELVRSKSELNLAKTFYSENIPYRYEFPYTITDDFGRPFQIYPDFTVLNKRTRQEYIVEYFGMMDNPEYVNNMIKKNETYSLFDNQNIKVLYIFESKDCPMNTAFINKLCKKYFL